MVKNKLNREIPEFSVASLPIFNLMMNMRATLNPSSLITVN